MMAPGHYIRVVRWGGFCEVGIRGGWGFREGGVRYIFIYIGWLGEWQGCLSAFYFDRPWFLPFSPSTYEARRGAEPPPAAAMMSVIRLPTLQIDQRSGGGVAVAGLGHAGDFAHQFHVAFSASVSGACVFSGQPFNCAVSKFAQDDLVAVTPHTRVPNCQGCPDGKTLPFDHCKSSPHVIDVGSMVDCPRRLTLSPKP